MKPEITTLPCAERRSELRRTCNNTSAELTIVDHGTSTVTTIPVMITDVSKSGLRVLANTRTSCGQQVRIKIEKLIIFGDVRHCRAHGPMFEIGISISNAVAHHGVCDRLTDEQIELLVLGRGLSAAEKMYAHFHVSHCPCCDEYFRANQEFLAKVASMRVFVSKSAQGSGHV